MAITGGLPLMPVPECARPVGKGTPLRYSCPVLGRDSPDYSTYERVGDGPIPTPVPGYARHAGRVALPRHTYAVRGSIVPYCVAARPGGDVLSLVSDSGET